MEYWSNCTNMEIRLLERNILEEKRAKDGILEQLHEYGNILEEKRAKDGKLEQLQEYD